LKQVRALFGRGKKSFFSFLVRIDCRADRIIFLLIAIYTIYFSAYTLFMHYTFKTYGWDLGIIDQSLWTTLNSGKLFFSTLEVPYGNLSGSFLGVHFSPILFLILPVYALFQSAETLLVFQSFILALAALPLYWLARDKLGNRLYALAFATSFLLAPALHGVNTFDFHLEIFTPVFTIFAFYYMDKERWFMALPFVLLELATIEFAPFIIFFLGLYFLLKTFMKGLTSDRRIGLSAKKLLFPIIVIGIAVCSLFVAQYTISAINPLKTGNPSGRWDNWGSTMSEAVNNILRNPGEAFTVMITPLEKPLYVIFLFAPVLFLPLLAPLTLLLPLPWIVVALLTDYQPYYQPYYQYSAFIIGQIYIGAVLGFSVLFRQNNQGNASRKIVSVMLLLSLLLFLFTSPAGLPADTTRSYRPYSINIGGDLSHFEQLHKVIDMIPRSASVATIHDIFPHVSNRLYAYFLKWPLDYDVEYVLVDVKSPTFTWGLFGSYSDGVTYMIMHDGQYGILAAADGVLLLKKGYSGPIQYYVPQKDTLDYGELIPKLGTVTRDYTSVSGKVIASKPESSIGFIWYGPYKYFVPGNYSATFRVKTENQTCGLLLDVAYKEGEILLREDVGSQLSVTDGWKNFTLDFRLPELGRLEFRGICVSNNTQVSVDYVKVEQLGP
jgi:uncharacterized membrane protein